VFAQIPGETRKDSPNMEARMERMGDNYELSHNKIKEGINM
jgi:hypothetical protein